MNFMLYHIMGVFNIDNDGYVDTVSIFLSQSLTASRMANPADGYVMASDRQHSDHRHTCHTHFVAVYLSAQCMKSGTKCRETASPTVLRIN